MDREKHVERTERNEGRRDEMQAKRPVLELDVEVLEDRIAPAYVGGPLLGEDCCS